jgi:hypothetical protein
VVKDMTMLYRVTFIQRDGTPGKPTLFQSEAVANLYAHNVMGTVEMVQTEADGFEVMPKRCEPGTAELQKEASRARFFADRAGEPYQSKAVREANRKAARANHSESSAEEMSEHFMDSRAAGMSTEDAFEDWAAKQGF